MGWFAAVTLLLGGALTMSIATTNDAAAAPGSTTDVAFTSAWDGTTQRYVTVTFPGVRAGADALIVLHGHGADRWQYVREKRGETAGARAIARRYGLLYVAPDYRGASWMGPAAEADLVQIITELRRSRGVRRVFLAGGSMGGTAALIFAGRHPELIAGVASANGTANLLAYDAYLEAHPLLDIRAAIHAAYGGPPSVVPEVYRERSPELRPERFTMPVAITCGGRDALVPPDSVRRLATRLQRLDRRVLIIDRPEGGHETNQADTEASLEFILRSAQVP